MIPWKFKNTEEYLHTTTNLSVSITFGYEFLEILKFIYPFCFHDNQGHICSTDSFYPHLFRANIGIITVKCYEKWFNSNGATITHVFVCAFDGLQWQQRSFWAFQNLNAHIRNVSKFHTIRGNGCCKIEWTSSEEKDRNRFKNRIYNNNKKKPNKHMKFLKLSITF
jgi:hypothetical protein